MCVFVRVCVCEYVGTCLRIYRYKHIHTHTHAQTHKHQRARGVRVCAICVCISVCVLACICALVCLYMCVRVCVLCVGFIHTHTYARTNTPRDSFLDQRGTVVIQMSRFVATPVNPEGKFRSEMCQCWLATVRLSWRSGYCEIRSRLFVRDLYDGLCAYSVNVISPWCC